MTSQTLVVDASAFVDLLLGEPTGAAVERRLAGERLVVPAHFDAEVLSGLRRLQRAGELSDRQVSERLRRTAAAPLRREVLPALLPGAWRRRGTLRVTDALYVELSHRLGDVPLITTDHRLAATVPTAELITAA